MVRRMKKEIKKKNKAIKVILIVIGGFIGFVLLFWFVIWPIIHLKLVDNECKSQFGSDYRAVKTNIEEEERKCTCIVPPWSCYNEKENITKILEKNDE